MTLRTPPAPRPFAATATRDTTRPATSPLHGILAALLYRDGSGIGQYIDCSAHEALSCTTEVGMPYYLYQRRDVIRQTSRHAAAARTEPWLHPTKDGLYNLIFGVARDNATWKKLKEWFQSEGFGLQFDEARFDTPAARQPGRGSPEAAEVMDEVARFIGGPYGRRGVSRRPGHRQRVGHRPLPEETLDDPHWHDRGFFVPVSGEGLDEPALMPGAPYMFSRTPWELRRPAPKLGEHTAEVLASL